MPRPESNNSETSADVLEALERPFWRRSEMICFVLFAGAVLGCVFYQYGDIPAGLFADDVSIGFNARCILRDLGDEDGTRLPLYFRSLDDYKSPLALYLTVLPEAILGPTKTAARVASALFLIAAAIAMFFLLRRLTGRPRLARWMAALFLTIPSIFFYTHDSAHAEGDSFVFTLVLALIAIERFERLPGKLSGLVAGAAIGLCTYSYATARLWAPLLLFATAVIFAFEVRHRRFVPGLLAGGVALGLPIGAYMLRHPDALLQRFHGESVFSQSNSLSQVFSRIAATYFTHLGSLDFLFRRGQMNDWMNFGPGLLPLWLFVPWALGFVVLWQRRSRPMFKLLLVSWFLYPIPVALTYASLPWVPHTTRSLHAIPIAVALGAVAIAEVLSSVKVTLPALVVAIAVLGAEIGQNMAMFFYDYGPRFAAQGGYDGRHADALQMIFAHRRSGEGVYLTHALYDDGQEVCYFADLSADDCRERRFEPHAIFPASSKPPPPGSLLALEGREPTPADADEIGRIVSEGRPAFFVIYKTR